ncbi:DegV family protein [Luteipulveratus mongoliensis]|uniref:DegV family protein n=1 Tax=Luteipulveratus mongoliensis TaxID=571913 RepID=UPI001FE08901|nr:DegV family protein [Luteipulveratus mongoliensis]
MTDSTAYLPSEITDALRIAVVPLHVVVAGRSYAEGREIGTAEVADALRAFRPVSTSKPSAGEFLDIYEKAAADGADEIVSIHISGSMSATVSSAQLAATDSPVPVTVVDSRSLGMAMGFAAMSAAQVAAAGGTSAQVVEAARTRALSGTTMFYVDTLEHLRRGGRIGKASALLGSALSIKPLLQLVDGQIEPLERVRTTSKALARLEERLVAAVEEMEAPLGIDIAVHHLDSEARAKDLQQRLRDRLPTARSVLLVEVGAVVGAHVGPGMLAVAASARTGIAPVIGAAHM